MKNKSYDRLVPLWNEGPQFSTEQYIGFMKNTIFYVCAVLVLLRRPMFDLLKNTVLPVRLIRCTDLSGRTPSWGAYIVVVGPSGCTHAFKRRQFRRRIKVIAKGRWKREE